MPTSDRLHDVADESELTGEALIKEGERLLKLGRELLVQSGALRDVAEAEVVQIDKSQRKINRSGQAVTLERARDAAVTLQAFSRSTFAEALGLKPVSVGRWLTRLEQEGVVQWSEEEKLYIRAPLPTDVPLPEKGRPPEKNPPAYTDAPKRGEAIRLEDPGKKGSIAQSGGRGRTKQKNRDRAYARMQAARQERSEQDKAKAPKKSANRKPRANRAQALARAKKLTSE